MNKRIILLSTFLLAAQAGCKKSPDEPAILFQTRKAADYEGRLAHEWMDLAIKMVRQNDPPDPQAARAFGYLGLAIHESVVHGIPGGKSLSGQVNDLADMPQPDFSQIYDWGIVLCSAMKMVVPAVIDHISAQQRSSIEVLAAVQESEMMHGSTVSAQEAKASRDFGIEIGNRIAKRAQNDGREIIRHIIPVLPERTAATPQYWDKTTLNQQPTEPMWSTLRTFVVDNSAACEADPPHPFSVENDSKFYADASEIRDNYPLSFSNKTTVYHWENGPGRTCGAAGHWVNITRQILEREGWHLAKSAQAWALVGMTVADAFSVAWYHQYRYNLLRPVTYIRENIDPSWSPAIFTPPSPDYISGSAAVGGAVPIVLKKLFGDVGFVDETHKGSPLYTPDGGPFILPERTFSTFTAAGEEQKEAQILGGVSFRRSAEQGFLSGKCIGSTIVSRIKLN